MINDATTWLQCLTANHFFLGQPKFFSKLMLLLFLLQLQRKRCSSGKCVYSFLMSIFPFMSEASHIFAIVSLLAELTGIRDSYLNPIAKATMIYFAQDLVSGVYVQLVDSWFEAISLTPPWRQMRSENRMTLKPYWDWVTLEADNTDTNISMMHSLTAFLLYLQKKDVW